MEGMDVDSDTWNVDMNHAIRNNDLHTVLELMEGGREVNATNIYLAISVGNDELLKLFLGLGYIDPNADYDSNELRAFFPPVGADSPLEHAILRDGDPATTLELVRTLLDLGARATEHHVALAMRARRLRIVQRLFATGIDIEATYNGQTLFDYGIEHGNVRTHTWLDEEMLRQKARKGKGKKKVNTEPGGDFENLQKCQRELRELNEELYDMSAKVVRLNGTNEHLENSINDFRKAIDACEAKLSSSQEEIQEMRALVAKLQEQLAECERKLHNKRDRDEEPESPWPPRPRPPAPRSQPRPPAPPSQDPQLPDGFSHPRRKTPAQFQEVDPTRQKAYQWPPKVHSTTRYRKGELRNEEEFVNGDRVYRNWICVQPWTRYWDEDAKEWKIPKKDLLKSCIRVKKGTGDYFDRDSCNTACKQNLKRD